MQNRNVTERVQTEISSSNSVQNQLEQFFKKAICTSTKISADDIDLNRPMLDYGLDSLAESELVAELNDWLNLDLAVYKLYQQPNITKLCEILTKQYIDRHSESNVE